VGDKMLRKDSRGFKNSKPKDHKGFRRKIRKDKAKTNDKFFERSTDNRSSNEGE
jgi:hypothetical protein